ncbi:MAG: SufD family Fe-S cluster assembly protein [Erysipelothrix sp.]|nr:SufD family Fe-S cluster assembly protein [Erysipelothrix sp.]
MLNQQIVTSTLKSNTIDINEDSSYNISFDSDSILFFNLHSINQLSINVSVLDNVRARIIFWSEEDSDITIKENYEVNRDAFLNIIYGELSSGNINRHMECNLYQGSELLVDGASVTDSKKHQTFIANHLEGSTTSNLNNYGIVSEGGNYFLDVVGSIVKGATGSKAHQDSRILTISDNQSATVLPQLLIDENDVEASHAATVGQIDEMQLYYMQSRGLSEMESMALLMSGYLMPIARAITDETLSLHVEELINSKVSEICSQTKK